MPYAYMNVGEVFTYNHMALISLRSVKASIILTRVNNCSIHIYIRSFINIILNLFYLSGLGFNPRPTTCVYAAL